MSQRWRLLLCFIISSSLISGCIHNLNKTTLKNSDKKIEFLDQFNDQKLNPEKWQITKQGDFKESIIDIIDVDPGEEGDYRLRLRANTIGTRDDTVKYLGVRCLHKIEFKKTQKISLDLDWNNQKNGCYLTAAIYICPYITDGNPKDEKDWLRNEYIGVPPGKNGRCTIFTRTNNRLRGLYTENWPQKKRGRPISYQKIDIVLDDKGFEILENGKNLYTVSRYDLNFDSGYLYLQMSSHTIYSAREIYFDNVRYQQL